MARQGKTTIRQPAAEMGRMAFRILRGQMTGRSGEADHQPNPVTLVLEPELVIRQTTAPQK